MINIILGLVGFNILLGLLVIRFLIKNGELSNKIQTKEMIIEDLQFKLKELRLRVSRNEEISNRPLDSSISNILDSLPDR